MDRASEMEMRRTTFFLLLTTALVGVGGCGMGNSPLKGAVHSIPIYTPSELIKSEPDALVDDWGENRRTAITWTLKTDDDREKVESFYKSQLPQAKPTLGDGVLTLEYLPERAVEGELIRIEIRDGEFTITEIVPEEKRP